MLRGKDITSRRWLGFSVCGGAEGRLRSMFLFSGNVFTSDNVFRLNYIRFVIIRNKKE